MTRSPAGLAGVTLLPTQRPGKSNDVDLRPWQVELLKVPDRKVVVSGHEEIALMEAERIRKGRFTG